MRAAILIPWAIPTIVSAKMWAWMLNDQFGIINDMLLNLGLIDQKIAWTANADTAMIAVLIVDIWKTTPFMALLILAGLQMIPQRHVRGGQDRRRPSGQGVLQGDAAAGPAGADGGGDLPRARRAAHLRPDLRADAEQRADQDDVGDHPREPVRLRQVRLRLAASTLLFLIIALLTIALHLARQGNASDGGTMIAMARQDARRSTSLVVVIVVVAVFPFYYAIITSLKSGPRSSRSTTGRRTFNFANYVTVFTRATSRATSSTRSSSPRSSSLFSLLLGVTAAYALARVRFRGRALLLLTILAVSMFPQIAVLAGLFELIRFLGIYNTRWALIFSYTIFTLPFTVWVLTTFMRDLPIEIEEAAIVDGATPWIIITESSCR